MPTRVIAEPIYGADVPLSFDVKTNDKRYHRASRVANSMSCFGITVLLAVGVLLLFSGIIQKEWPIAGIGIASLGFCGWMLPRLVRSIRQRLDLVLVSLSEITLQFSDRSSRTFRWGDPALKLDMVDYSAVVGGGRRSLALVPCGIMVGHGLVGISLEAVKAIRASAKNAGVPVIYSPPNELCSHIWVGNWPNIPRPFSDVDPYA
jgi:hypothetical protein